MMKEQEEYPQLFIPTQRSFALGEQKWRNTLQPPADATVVEEK